VEPTHAHSITYSEVGNVQHRGTDLGDDSDAFVSESLIGVTVVLICTADTAVGYLDDNFGWFGVAVAFGLDDLSGFGTFEDSEIDTHGCRYGRAKLSNKNYFEKNNDVLFF
jgi:hypothetical protein